MSSNRKAIRKAVADALRGNTAVGTRVFDSRSDPLWSEELPAILVYSKEEDVSIFNASPRELRRVLNIAVEIVAEAPGNIDDTLDDIAGQVEHIMSEHQTLSDTASDVQLVRTDLQIAVEGEQQSGSALLTYQVTYYTMDVSLGVEGPGVPDENVLRPFERASVKYRVPPANGEPPPAEDLVSMPQQ